MDHLDGPSQRLLADLTSPDPDLDELQRVLLVKMRALTDGTVLSEGGAPVMRQVRLFIQYQPELFRRGETPSIIRSVLSSPKPALGKRANAQGQAPETVYTIAAAALFGLYKDSENWPLELLRYYLLDALGPRHWVDYSDLSMLTKNLIAWSRCRFKPRHEPETLTTDPVVIDGDTGEEEELLEEGGAEDCAQGDLGGQIVNRFSHCMSEAKEEVLAALCSRIDSNNKIKIDSSSELQSTVLCLTAFCGISEVRALSIGCLPRLLGHVAITSQVGLLHAAIADELSQACQVNVTVDSYDSYFQAPPLPPNDMAAVRQLVKLRGELQLNQQGMFRAMMCKLAKPSAALGRLVLQVLFEDEKYWTGSLKADSIKLIISVLESLERPFITDDTVKIAAGLERSEKKSMACKLFALVVHDILTFRLDVTETVISATPIWSDDIIIEVIVKVLRSMNIQKVSIPQFFKDVLVDPILATQSLTLTAGYMPSVERVTGTRQNLFSEIIIDSMQETVIRRKAVSDVFWALAEISKILQALLAHQVCLLGKKPSREKSVISDKSGSSIGQALSGGLKKTTGVLNTLNGGRGGLAALCAGRVGGRGIPVGLTLNRSGQKQPRPLPSPAMSRAMGGNINSDARVEVARARSGSVGSADGENGGTDAADTTAQTNLLKRQLYLDILSLQEASISWLDGLFSMISSPAAMCCSLVPSGNSSGRSMNAPGDHLPSTLDYIHGEALGRDAAVALPCGDSPAVFVAVSGGTASIVEMKDDHVRLWMSWVKICVFFSAAPIFKGSNDFDRNVPVSLKENGFVSSLLVSKIIGIAQRLNAHSYNNDVSRLRDEVEVKGKGCASSEASSPLIGNVDVFSSNRQRDALLIVHALDLIDFLVLRGVKTTFSLNGSDRVSNGVIVDDVKLIHKVFSMSQLFILKKEQRVDQDSSSEVTQSTAGVTCQQREVPELPPLALKTLFWRCAVSCYILGCANPTTMGLYIWNNVPIVKSLLLMSITAQFGDNGDVKSAVGADASGGAAIIVGAEAAAAAKLLKAQSQTCLFAYSHGSGSSSARQQNDRHADGGAAKTGWKYDAPNGIELVVKDGSVSPGSSCTTEAFRQAVLLLEKAITATLFTELEGNRYEILRKKKNERKMRKLKAIESKKENQISRQVRGDFTSSAGSAAHDEHTAEGSIKKKRPRDEDITFAVSASYSGHLIENVAEEETRANSSPKRSKTAHRELDDMAPIFVETTMPKIRESSTDRVRCSSPLSDLTCLSDVASDSGFSSDIASEETASSLGLRRSGRIRTAVKRFDVGELIRSGGSRRGIGSYAGYSSDDEAVRKKRKKRKRKGKKA